MEALLSTVEQDGRIFETLQREQRRLRNFIRKRVPDESDVEDILQDVFFQLVEAYRLMKPVEQVGAWLFRVTRNRIADFFRKKKAVSLDDLQVAGDDGQMLQLEEILPSPEGGPEALYARKVLLEELDAALDELPSAQREVFLAHELEGQSFKELAEETGLSVNTLLARKRYAVLQLRRQLQTIYEEFVNT